MTHNTDKSDLPHECKYCLKRFANPEHLNRHIIEHTENITYSEKYRRLRCGKCRHSFKDKKAMDEHTCVPIRRIKGMTYSCKVCQKVYKSPSAMYSHTKTMHGVKTKVSLADPSFVYLEICLKLSTDRWVRDDVILWSNIL